MIVTIVRDEEGEWEALYCGDDLCVEGHSISAMDALLAVSHYMHNTTHTWFSPKRRSFSDTEVFKGNTPTSLRELLGQVHK